MRAPLVVGAASMAAGLAAGLQRPVPVGGGPLQLWGAVGALAVALGLASGGRWGSGRSGVGGRARGRACLVLMAGAGLLLGTSARTVSERSCEQWIPAGVPLRIVATVEGVGEGPDNDRLRLRTDSVGVGRRGVICRARLPARWEPGGERPWPGARVEAIGEWWEPPGARSALRRPGTLLLDTVTIRAVRAAAGRRSLRQAASDRVGQVFPRHPELVRSLLLAERDGLDPEVRERYARAGLSHLLAISGLHVGLVAGILILLTGTLRTRHGHSAALAAAGTVAYVLFLGAPHSAARAALQIVLVLASRALQRPTRAEALVGAAALVLLTADPSALAQPGFQLSFAGVAGILALRRPLLDRMRPLQRIVVRDRSIGRWVADSLATSVAATLATAPIVAWHFGRVAPIGVAANILAIPLLGAVVPALGLSLAVGALWLPAGRYLAGGAERLLDLLDGVAAAAAAVPYGTVSVTPTAAAVLTAAVIPGYYLSRGLGRVRPVFRTATWGAAVVAVLTLAPLRHGGDRVELHVIDVGQGDAIAIRSPGGRWVLVDAGIARRDYDAGARRVVPYLRRQSARRLEALIISHPDADHMGGAAAVAAALHPAWVGGPALVAAKTGYLELLRAARESGRPWVAVRRGMEVELDGMRLSFLYPERPGLELDDANDGSVVLRVSYGDFSALLTGDAPMAVEERLARRYGGGGLEAEVLKVGHHGSATSTGPALLEATGARTALISVGRGNRYGHPHPAVVARLRHQGLDVFRTDRHGTVVVRGSGDGRVEVRTERGGRVQEGVRAP